MKVISEILQVVADSFGQMFGMIMFGIGVLLLIWGAFWGPWYIGVIGFCLTGLGAYLAAKKA